MKRLMIVLSWCAFWGWLPFAGIIQASGGEVPDAAVMIADDPDLNAGAGLIFTADVSGVPFPADPAALRLAFAGDVMLARDVDDLCEDLDDFSFPMAHVAGFLEEADLAFVNLESVISDRGYVANYWYYLLGVSFRADPRCMEALISAGIDIVSMANNHTLDYGRNAQLDCYERLIAEGIAVCGSAADHAAAYAPVVVDVKGFRVAFLAYTKSMNSTAIRIAKRPVAMLDEDAVLEGISMARELDADLIVVSMHFGKEYSTSPDSDQMAMARLAIDAGADLVIGHHPHVVQPVEAYNGGVIAYSLGNFVFDQEKEGTRRGLLLEVIADQGAIVAAVLHPVDINPEFQPVFAAE